MTPQQFLRDARIKLGIQQKTVAYDLGVTPAHLGFIENARTRLTFDMAVKLCEYYRISPVVLAAISKGEKLVNGL